MSRQRGYTLLEMLIVVALIAVLVALAFPAMRGSLAKRQLRDAASQLRIELAKARLKAIDSGTVGMFRYQPGTGRFIRASQAIPAGDDAFASPLDEEVAVDSPPEREQERKLAHGVRFVDAEWEPLPHERAMVVHPAEPATFTVSSEASATSASPLDAQADGPLIGQREWSKPIFFYPTGRTSSARLRLLDRHNNYVDVTLRGLTGSVKIGQLQRPRPLEEML